MSATTVIAEVADANPAAEAVMVALPPLSGLYARRDGFSSLTVTIVFAVYALAVALSLFLAGHLSDWHGRRRVLIPALALEILAPSGPCMLTGRSELLETTRSNKHEDQSFSPIIA